MHVFNVLPKILTLKDMTENPRLRKETYRPMKCKS